MISIPSPLAIRFAQAHAKAKDLASRDACAPSDDFTAYLNWNREFSAAIDEKCQTVDAIGDWLMGERFHEWEGEP